MGTTVAVVATLPYVVYRCAGDCMEYLVKKKSRAHGSDAQGRGWPGAQVSGRHTAHSDHSHAHDSRGPRLSRSAQAQGKRPRSARCMQIAVQYRVWARVRCASGRVAGPARSGNETPIKLNGQLRPYERGVCGHRPAVYAVKPQQLTCGWISGPRYLRYRVIPGCRPVLDASGLGRLRATAAGPAYKRRRARPPTAVPGFSS
jgi:hypothetical protein